MSTVLQNRDRLLQRHDGPGGSQSSYDFTESSNGFTQSSYGFTQSSYDFTESRYGFTQSSYGFTVLIFTESSFIFFFYTVQFFFFFFYTVQFYFYTVNTQSTYIFCVVTRPLSLYCNLTAAILYFLATMDSIIRQAVREELRRSSSSRPETASSTNQDDQGRSENESGLDHHEVRFITNSGPFLKRRPKTPRRGYSLIRA